MGMAASQARYLALVARKSNCEYEGQQINQARTALSNQSANLFNQMLGLSVPVPPSTQDFTKTQYSYKDGTNSSTISDWQQLSSADPDYNYVVTHYYYTDKYTGSQKKLSDPQVQFSSGTGATATEIQTALKDITEKSNEYEAAKAETEKAKQDLATLSKYAVNINDVTKCELGTDGKYTVTKKDSTTRIYTPYKDLTTDEQENIVKALQSLKTAGALDESTDTSSIYYDSTNKTMVFLSDLQNLVGSAIGNTGTNLPTYLVTGENSVTKQVEKAQEEVKEKKDDENDALIDYNNAVDAYKNLSRPTYIGNCELTPIETLTADQQAEINQIIADMKEQGINDSISKCFDANGNYTGGIYSFKLNGVNYYTTYDDLFESYTSGTGNNHIDGQTKLAYYNATYVSTKVEKTEKALLETDGNGRFTSIRFEDDSITYTLSMETITDDNAYQDAMNQYYYDNAVYDKTVQDINAKTSLIQQEDLQLELRLKQLDTEQNALSTEIDAVKKVVDDNVESSFKTFGG